MFAALVAALMTAVLSLAGASLVLAGQGANGSGDANGNNGNGNAYAYGHDKDNGSSAPAPAPAPAPASGESQGNANGHAKQGGDSKPEKPAKQHPSPKQHSSAPSHSHANPTPGTPRKGGREDRPAGKITICHATGSATNPYVEITISVNGLHGHGKHQDGRDIIPAPAGGCPGGQPSGTKEHGGGKEHQHGKITICHATGSATNPYVEITISVNGLHGHAKHQDGRDIIPAPAEGCPGAPATPPAGGEQPGSTTPPTPGGEQPAALTAPQVAAPEVTVTQPATQAPASEQLVLGERVSGSSTPKQPAGGQEVLGENASGGSAPAPAAQAVQPADNQGGSLPFTGTDAMLVLFLGCLMLIGGVTVQRLTARRSS